MKKIRIEPREESEAREEDKKYHCEVCGKEISEEEYEAYDGLCWECWDDPNDRRMRIQRGHNLNGIRNSLEM